MSQMMSYGPGAPAPREEIALRRRLVLRLLREFDFNAPVFHGELLYRPATKMVRRFMTSARR